jgi:Zn-dependent M28 family amino/carboxypeptidase
MLRKTALSFLVLCCACPVLADGDEDKALQGRLEAHITFLADDLLRGRQPGTEGYDIAAAYVASQFRQMGLRPAGVEGSYFQPVPLRRAWLDEGSATVELLRGEQARSFRFVEEFYRGASLAHARSDVRAGMVFAGYGIDAPALEYNDFDGIDVTGKVMVVLMGQPLDFPSEEGAHFSSGREIFKNAVSRGAVGVIMIHTPRTEHRFAWNRVESLVGTPSMGWLQQDGKVFADFEQLLGGAMVNSAAAAALFEGAGHSLAELLEKDAAGEPVPGFELPGEIRMSQSSRHESISSPNVAAYLPGGDPLLGDEFLVYTAHLDHIGELSATDHEDRINNGALDNASGVSVMLETARLFAQGEPARRSVLFLAVTAEEKGLVGSEYFAQNPTVPLEQLAGVVNLDMPLLLYDFGDVIAFGAEHSTIGDAVQQAADRAGVALTPDPFPEQNIFVRSDHYRFVQQGVPAVFLVTGVNSADGTTDTQAIFEGFLKDHYHTPSDDLALPINYRAAARFTRVNFGIGDIIANQLERPRWREGDFFGDTFGR